MSSDEISDVSFDLILTQMIGDTPARILIQIPGIDDILSQHFQSDVPAIYEADSEVWESPEDPETERQKDPGLPLP